MVAKRSPHALALCSLLHLGEDELASLRRRLDGKLTPEPISGCWLWTGTLDVHGYGTMMVRGKRPGPHRVAWLLEHGDIPEGLVIDHRCRQRTCCNPAHLELVSNAENIRRGLACQLRRRRCKRGHDLTMPESRRASGRCRLCFNAAQVAQRAARRASRGEVAP